MSPKSKDLFDVLVDKLLPLLGANDFIFMKSEKCFEQKSKEFVKRIIPYFDRRSRQGVFNLGFVFNVRINKLEDVVNSCKPYITSNKAKKSISASWLLLGLTDRNVSDWNYSSGEEIVDDLEIIFSEIEKYGIGFLDKYCHVKELMKCLESEECSWPVPTEENRAQTLLALYICTNSIEKFNKMLPVLNERLTEIQDGFFKEDFNGFVNNLLEHHPEFRMAGKGSKKK